MEATQLLPHPGRFEYGRLLPNLSFLTGSTSKEHGRGSEDDMDVMKYFSINPRWEGVEPGSLILVDELSHHLH